jgi:hypothetical protein
MFGSALGGTPPAGMYSTLSNREVEMKSELDMKQHGLHGALSFLAVGHIIHGFGISGAASDPGAATAVVVLVYIGTIDIARFITSLKNRK